MLSLCLRIIVFNVLRDVFLNIVDKNSKIIIINGYGAALRYYFLVFKNDFLCESLV